MNRRGFLAMLFASLWGFRRRRRRRKKQPIVLARTGMEYPGEAVCDMNSLEDSRDCYLKGMIPGVRIVTNEVV